MRKTLLVLASAALALSAGQAMAQKKVLAIVVKGLDNPFFEAIHKGCEKWNSENADSEYTCFYTGPASTSDEAGEAQIVGDLLAKSDTAAMAISPSNAPLIANTIKSANPQIPIMTVDADLAKEDAALRKTYLGTDNYLMGKKLGEYLKDAMPNGGKVCLIEGNPAADNILRRAQGTRDALTGKEGIDALKGEGGWTEVSGCPVFTNDDGAKGVQAMTDIRDRGRLAALRRAAALSPADGPLQGQDGEEGIRRRRRRHDRRRDRHRQGRPRQHPGRPAAVRDGLQGAERHDRPDRRQDGRGPGLHRPRRLHARHDRQLHPAVTGLAASHSGAFGPPFFFRAEPAAVEAGPRQ
jgi:DNA-binding LacI/PurR family transcriptional regulator